MLAIMMNKEFETYYVRCKKCGVGKPKEEFKGAIGRVCRDCRAESVNVNGLVFSPDHYKR